MYPISGKEPTDPKMSSDWSHISASMRETKKNIIDPKAAQNFFGSVTDASYVCVRTHYLSVWKMRKVIIGVISQKMKQFLKSPKKIRVKAPKSVVE